MVADKIEFTVQKRETQGTAEARRMRKTGMVPGVIYGGGNEAAQVQLNEHAFALMLGRHASEYLLIDLTVDDDAPRKVLLKEVQHHPLTSKILHVDFHEVDMNQKVKIEIYINYVGTPVGVTQGGGTADFHLRVLQVECLPGDIIESFDLDISAMEVGEHLIVSDISTLDAEKYSILTAGDVSTVSIAKPRVSGKDAGGDGEDGAEPAEGETADGEGDS